MLSKDSNFIADDSFLWYFAGLITADGSLSKDGRHIDITSRDEDYLVKIKNKAALSNKIGLKYSQSGSLAYRIQFGNVDFYNFLKSIGLKPNKSLTLKGLKIDERYFSDFIRGVIDGDGCIRRWAHPKNKGEQWSLRIYSGSKEFLDWLKEKIETCFRASGRIHKENQGGTKYILTYGKMAAQEILKASYYKGSFALERKNRLAIACVVSPKGWSKSKTVLAG